MPNPAMGTFARASVPPAPMRSTSLPAAALALLLPVPGNAAPKKTPHFPHDASPSPKHPKVPTHRPTPKPAKKPTFDPPHRPQPQVPQIDPSKVYTPPVPIKGDLSCRRGDADCNPCTADVRGQFAKMRRGESRWKDKPWRFEWGREYAPDSITPYEAFDDDSDVSNAFGVGGGHPQAFVRTNVGPAWYAGTHSQKEAGRPGTVFVIDQSRSGRKRLVALHRTKTQHPNGLHVLGQFLLFAERPSSRNPDELRVIDLRRRTSSQDITHLVPEAAGDSRAFKQFGGGLGTAKLSDGSYLLISTVPGDRKTRDSQGRRQHRFHQFYNMRGDLSDPSDLRIRFLDAQRFTPNRAVPQKYEFSENLSLVTECRTADIYAVHSSGDGEALDGLEGKGYWRLSKLVRVDGNPRLDPVDVFEIGQSAQRCHMRSAASVGVAPNGKLEFLCHQYRKDPDPSAVNPFGGNISGKDHWNFRAGGVRD